MSVGPVTARKCDEVRAPKTWETQVYLRALYEADNKHKTVGNST
jgi:hypothetical protein